ncbi:UPF0175 family protein [Endozoicomonas lisbonensis]
MKEKIHQNSLGRETMSEHLLSQKMEAVRLFSNGSISLDYAARLAQCSLESFILAAGSLGATIVDYPPNELTEELNLLES